ncbi:MAG TPA: TetR/AcrR family transcriptional regulator [Longimicrobiales bacterium]|nr:TetR/AcrR family transcriptional regulator [Longimicrobiales bacterium]
MAKEEDGAPEDGARRRLLSAVVEHALGHGISDLSLRELAAAVGTSHRMLLYHFGSKAELLVAVARAVAERQRQCLAELTTDPARPPGETLRRLWARLSDPRLDGAHRLFFELYGQALQGRPGAVRLLDDVIDAWITPFAEYERRRGLPAAEAREQARLGLAVMRGLLLDLLTTGDRAGVDRALERFVEQVEARDAARA